MRVTSQIIMSVARNSVDLHVSHKSLCPLNDQVHKPRDFSPALSSHVTT